MFHIFAAHVLVGKLVGVWSEPKISNPDSNPNPPPAFSVNLNLENIGNIGISAITNIGVSAYRQICHIGTPLDRSFVSLQTLSDHITHLHIDYSQFIWMVMQISIKKTKHMTDLFCFRHWPITQEFTRENAHSNVLSAATPSTSVQPSQTTPDSNTHISRRNRDTFNFRATLSNHIRLKHPHLKKKPWRVQLPSNPLKPHQA